MLIGIIALVLLLAGGVSAETLTYVKDGNAFSSANGSYATSSHCSGEVCRWISGNQVIVGVYDANPVNWGGSVTWNFNLNSINFGKIRSAEIEIQWPSYYGKGLHSPEKNGSASIYVNSNNIANLTVKPNIRCYPADDYFAHPCNIYSLKYNIPINYLSQNTDIKISAGSKTAWDVGNVKIYIYLNSSASSITVISPNGGENWKRGTTQTIRWEYTGSPGSLVNITLLKGGIFNRTINSSTSIGSSGSGSYSWLINSSQTPGTDYKVRITSTTNSAFKDSSNNNFAISEPVNLLKNPGFETATVTVPQYWSKSQTGIKAVFTYPEIGRVGTGKSVAIKYTTKETGKVALWQQSGIIVVPSKQYKLSGYMKLANVTGGRTGRFNGASLRINWYTSTGTLIKVDRITKSGTSAWTKYENTFMSPSNAVKANVGGDLFNSSGKVTFDDMSFMRIS